jgi:predicted nuclease with TOPRIM domain
VDWDKTEEGYAEGYDQTAILAVAVQAVKELTTRDSEQQKTIERLAERDSELAEQNQTLREEVRLLKSRLDAFEQTIKLAAS